MADRSPWLFDVDTRLAEISGKGSEAAWFV